jgi:DNA-directed RNA polymerase specialized sigma24 family protein
MKKDWVLTPESFTALLAWLHPDRNEAGKKYEDIRRRLIKIFTCRGCCESEDLADESINRVISRVEDLADTFTGDPALYFYGVANKVHQEYVRRRPVPAPPMVIDEQDNLEEQSACLDKCMEKLTPANRQLVVQYYQEEKRAKIEHRKQLADQMGIALNALRIRAHRIRSALQLCVQTCLQEMI